MSTKGLGLTDGHPDPKIGPQVYLGPIKIDKDKYKDKDNGKDKDLELIS